MITPQPVRMEDVFLQPFRYFVPKFQREFAWKKDEAQELFEDLKSYEQDPKEKLYLGTMIFNTSSRDKMEISVVDGQQRLTTMLLLLIACRQHAVKISELPISQIIQDRITFVDSATAESLGPRLVASESIKDVFEHISSAKWDGNFPEKVGAKQVKRQTNRIKPVYEYFMEKISSYTKVQLSEILNALYNSYIVKIDIQDDIEAFKIFERTNARGIDLDAADLLKNYLFASRIEGLEEKWRQIIIKSDGNILRMLKYFHVANNGFVRKSELYKKMREYARSFGEDKFVENLTWFSTFYLTVMRSEKNSVKDYFDSLECKEISGHQDKYESVYYAIEGLQLFKISQIIPLIYAITQSFILNGRENKKGVKTYINLLHALEKYHFINTAICGRMGNEVEKIYADYCVKFKDVNNYNGFSGVTNEFTTDIKKKLAGRDEFEQKFADLAYSQDQIPLIVYIFDRINNNGLKPGQRIPLYNPDRSTIRKNHNIEHFLPKTPPSGQQYDQDTINCLDNIGNLLVISYKTNGDLGNLSPSDKIQKLSTPKMKKEIQNLHFVGDFVDKYTANATNWGCDTIKCRAKELANLSYDIVWKLR